MRDWYIAMGTASLFLFPSHDHVLYQHNEFEGAVKARCLQKRTFKALTTHNDILNTP